MWLLIFCRICKTTTKDRHLAVSDCTHPSDRTWLMNPPVAIHPPPACLGTVQAQRRELHVEETTSARDSPVRVASRLPMSRAQPGPWPGGTRKEPLFQKQSRSRQGSSLGRSQCGIYFWSLHPQATWSRLAAIVLVTERCLEKDEDATLSSSGGQPYSMLSNIFLFKRDGEQMMRYSGSSEISSFFLCSAAKFWDTLLTPSVLSVTQEMEEKAQLRQHYCLTDPNSAGSLRTLVKN